jgi:DinB family protein/pentapeptide repeat protein
VDETTPDAGEPREFVDVDWSGAVLREVVLSGARMTGVLLDGADIDGVIDGLVVNGVEVAPLIEAELDRRHPERLALRPTDAESVRTAWAVAESMWEPTMARAAALPEADVWTSVRGEWCFADTLRHLVFVVDLWLGVAVLGSDDGFHPLGMPAAFMDGARFGVDASVRPTYAEVVAARDDRVAQVRDFVAGLSDADLAQPRTLSFSGAERTVLQCLRVILNEEWAHHRFAVRDLDLLKG